MISPFKDQKLLEKEIRTFINKYKATVKNQSKRISDYFEMSCYNYIVKFYESTGHDVEVSNLKGKQYRYKCSTAGVQSNFSHFRVRKVVGRDIYEFEIQHNLAVQSGHDPDLFTTPDITVIKAGSSKTSTTYYDIKRRFSFVENGDLVSFFEVKHFNPYPELIFNFIGTINELRPHIISNSAPEHLPKHLAPGLMMSGKPNKQTTKIKQSLEKRYCINIFFDLFWQGSKTFAKVNLGKLKYTGKN